MKRTVSGILLTLFLIGLFSSFFNLSVAAARSGDETSQESSPTNYSSSEHHEPPPTEWNKTYGGTGLDYGFSMVQTGDGGYAIAGYTESYGAGSGDVYLVRTDSAGGILWNKTYGGTDYDYGYSVIQTVDGGYAIAGYTTSYGGIDVYLVKTDSSGTMLWNKTYGGTGLDIGYSVVQTGDGGYAIAGYADSYGAGDSDLYLVKTDSSGTMLWNKTYGGTSNDLGYSMVQTSDGGYAIAGYTHSYGAGFANVYLVKTDSSGMMLWNRTYGGAVGQVGWPVIQTSDGGYAIAGYTASFGAGGDDVYLVKTDSSGTMLWNKTYGGTDSDHVYSMVQTGDGGYAIAGYTTSFGAGYDDVYLVKTDVDGNLLWNQTYGGANIDEGCHVVQTGDGGYAIAGYTESYGAGSSDVWLIKVEREQIHDRYSWPMSRHDLKHTGCTESPAPNTNQTQWTYNVGGGVVYSSPAVADDRVYVGSMNGKVYCLDAFTGAQIWNYSTGGAVKSSPAVAEGKVYVGSQDGSAYCLDALTGAQLWNFTSPTLAYFESSPAVADGKVYIAALQSGTLYCLDASTGSQTWNFSTGYDMPDSPAVAYDRVYIASWDNKLYCLNAANGSQLWSYTTPNYFYVSPTVAGDKVYIGSGGELFCLNALTGAYVWETAILPTQTSSPAAAYDRVYIGANDANLYCFNALTGSKMWNFTMGVSGIGSSPAVADGKVYIGSSDFSFYCIDAFSGSHIWSYTTVANVMSSPAIADGVLYIGEYDKVYAFGNVVRFPEDYPTIQEAIDASAPGATIWIAPGIYNESLVINKTLTLIGKVGSSPIFRGGGSGTAITLLPGASGSIIAGIVITNWDRGILVANSANCKIYDNIMSSINKNGIVIEGTNAANNIVYSNIFQQNAIAINLTASSATNTIYKNIITSNTVGLKLESDGNFIYANSIAQNELGINVSSSGNTIYHNDFIDNAAKISISPSATNTWDDGYPSGGNYWGESTWVDKYKGPAQNQEGSDGVNDTAYAIDQNNVDRYPLLQPFSRHDIGVTQVLASKSIVAQGSTVYVDVKILNYGVYDETLTVTIYTNAAIISRQVVAVATRSSVAVAFAWSTVGVAKADYIISAVVDVLPDETDLLDNTLTDGTVTISIAGDVTGDIWVDMQDISLLIDKFMATPADLLRWDPNCDINDDLTIDMADIQLAIDHFMQS